MNKQIFSNPNLEEEEDVETLQKKKKKTLKLRQKRKRKGSVGAQEFCQTLWGWRVKVLFSSATPSSGVVLPWGVVASLISIKIQPCISRYSQNQTRISLQTHPKLELATKNKNKNLIGVEPNNKPGGRNPGVDRVVGEKKWGWERGRNCCEWEMGSADKCRAGEGWCRRRWSRWVVGEKDWWWLAFWTEGGAVELCFACGGTVECGSAFWRKEKTGEWEGRELRVGEQQSQISGFRKVILHLCFYFWF